MIGKAFVIVWPPIEVGMAVDDGTSTATRRELCARRASSRIAGVDEVGRGALAGPLVAAAVVLPDGLRPTGIRDSKLLTARQREAQFERIIAACVVRGREGSSPP